MVDRGPAEKANGRRGCAGAFRPSTTCAGAPGGGCRGSRLTTTQRPKDIVSVHGLLYMYSKLGVANMLALRLPPEIEQRLDALAKKTGRSKSYYAREAILRQIEDIEDYYLARRRLGRGGPRVTLESLERELKKRTKR
jgi:RHH-type rel operon transcriptional repressor/antitoxin RelB